MTDISPVGSYQKQKGAEPELLPQPRPRGEQNSTRPTPPFGGVAQGTASVQEPCGSGWSFWWKQFLTHARQFQIVIEANGRPRMWFLFLLLKTLVRRPLRLKMTGCRMGDKLQVALVQFNDGLAAEYGQLSATIDANG